MSRFRNLFFASILSFSGIAFPLFATSTPPIPEDATVARFGGDVATSKSPEIRQDDDAFHGEYSAPKRAYETLASAPLPPGEGPLYIWVHYRNLALQMKSLRGEETKVFPWNWSRHSKKFAWRKVGVFERDALGESVYFINDTRWDESSGIDGVLITNEKDWTPPGFTVSGGPKIPANPDAPDAANATVLKQPIVVEESNEPGTAELWIDWDKKLGKVDPAMYSLNNFRGFSPKAMANPTWHEATSYMNPGLIRLHNAALVKAWYNKETDDWNYDMIQEALESGAPPNGTSRMINITSWPEAYDQNGDRRLDEDRIEDFARLCADLVHFVNLEIHAQVEYWEVTNEKDFAYWRKPAKGLYSDVPALAHLYKVAARAMRETDPSIKIGGPAVCSPLPVQPIVEFAVLAQEELDFLSFHHYATGNNKDSDQVVYEKAIIMAEDASELISSVEEAIPDKDIEFFLDEYNICYNWRIPEIRMRNHKGAVFDAISLVSYAQVPGLTGTNAWNDIDRVYGKFGNDGEARPSAHVFHYFNQYLQGERVLVESSDPKSVLLYAVENQPDELLSFVVINRTNGLRTVTANEFPENTEMTWNRASIDADGHHESVVAEPFAAPIKLPPHSVTFFWGEV